MSTTIDIILRALGGSTVRTEIKGVADEAKRMGAAIDGAGTKAKSAASGLGQMEAKAKSSADAFQAAAAQTENLNNKLNNVKNWGAGMALAGAGGVILSNSLVKAGQDAEESQNLVKESFGSSLAAAQAWSEGLQNSLGISAGEARKSAATFNVMFESMGLAKDEAFNMATGLTELANDMASFYNLSPEEAFDKLRAGITGEAEPLKALGVLINETTVKAKAMEMGIAGAGGVLSEQAKVQARYALIVEQTSKAHGDMARTMDSGANVSRRAEAQYKMTMVAIGTGSAAAQKQLDLLGASIIGIAGGNEKVASTIGWVFTMGSHLLAAGGAALAFAAQLGQAYLGMIAMRNARAANNIVAAAGIPLSATSAIAVNAEAAAAGRASLAYGAMARIKALAMSPMGIAAVGLAVGGVGAEAIRRVQVASGDKAAAGSFGEMASNAWARLTGDSEGVTDLEGKTIRQRKAEAAQAEIEGQQKKSQDAMNAMIAGAGSSGAMPFMPSASPAMALADAMPPNVTNRRAPSIQGAASGGGSGVRTFTAEPIQTRTPAGQIRIDFKPIVFDDPFSRAMGAF